MLRVLEVVACWCYENHIKILKICAKLIGNRLCGSLISMEETATPVEHLFYEIRLFYDFM